MLLAPAMHTEMWDHPATRANVATLRSRGVHVLDPASGRLTGADTGPGRLPEPEEIFAAAGASSPAPRPYRPRRPSRTRRCTLAGRRVVVSAGGTREPLDPVRFLGQPVLGQAGLRARAVAAARGADVTLVAANTSLPAPTGVDVVPVGTVAGAPGRRHARRPRTPTWWSWRRPWPTSGPRTTPTAKIKKTFAGDDPDHDTSAPTIELVRNPDILAGLVGRARQRQLGR